MTQQFCGNIVEDTTQRMSTKLLLEIKSGKVQKCLSCVVANMRQKNVPKKITHEHKKNANGRVLLDISTIKAPKGIKAKATKPN